MNTASLNDKCKLTKFELIFLLSSALLTITFVSTCSPLYPFNPWDDANCFFTIGRGIVKGLTLYKDLFDHKGPLLYFIYAVAALISDKSFVGIWIIECLAASAYAIYSWKIARLFVNPSKYSVFIMPLFLGVVYTSRMFNFGGNAEELCFPLLTIMLYIGLKAAVKGDGIPGKSDALICGLITGSLFWIKYTFVGFAAGLCLFILILSIKQKRFVRLWSLVWRFVAGFVIISIPVFNYFIATKSLDYLWESYFYDNLALYLTKTDPYPATGIPVLENIVVTLIAIKNTAKEHLAFGVLFLLTVVSLFFVEKKYRLKVSLLFLVTFAASAGFVFTRSIRIYYYGYILFYCLSLAVVPVIKAINLAEKAAKRNPRFISLLISALFVVLYLFSIFMCKNIYLIFKPKDFLAQYRVAEIINQTPEAKILTYGVMDEGFYTAAGLLPANRFFGAGKNIEANYPAIHEEQDRLIDEGYFDYIITSYFLEPDWENYELIQTETDPYIDFTGEEILIGHKIYKKI